MRMPMPGWAPPVITFGSPGMATMAAANEPNMPIQRTPKRVTPMLITGDSVPAPTRYQARHDHRGEEQDQRDLAHPACRRRGPCRRWP